MHGLAIKTITQCYVLWNDHYKKIKGMRDVENEILVTMHVDD